MKIIAKCGHEIEITEEESKIDAIVEYKQNFCCDDCEQNLPKEKPTKTTLRDTMSGIASHYEDEGKKWNPITKTWGRK